MGVEEAVVMLQRHERARQGQLRAKLMLEIRRQENAEKNKGMNQYKYLFTIFIYPLPIITFNMIFDNSVI